MIDRLIGTLKPHLDSEYKSAEEILKKDKRSLFYVPASKILFVGLPGWGSSFSSRWNGLKRFTERKKISLLLYEFPREILTSNSLLTKECFHQIAEKAREDIDRLNREHGFSRIFVLAYSLGSVLGSMVYKNNPAITDILHVCPGNNLAEDMWHGCHTQFLRKVYEEKGTNLEELKLVWKDLAPENNIPPAGSNISIFYGKYDEVIRYPEGKKLMRALEKHGFKVLRRDLPTGHYFACASFLLFP